MGYVSLPEGSQIWESSPNRGENEKKKIETTT